jgi:hypothetical protein
LELGERRGLAGRVPERLCRGVVAVAAKVVDGREARPVGAGAAVALSDGERGSVEVIGSEVGPQIRAVAEDRAVLHQPVAQEELLAVADVRTCKDGLARRIDDARRNRGLGLIRAIGEQAEDEEAGEDNEDDRLQPALRDEQRPPSGMPALFDHEL